MSQLANNAVEIDKLGSTVPTHVRAAAEKAATDIALKLMEQEAIGDGQFLLRLTELLRILLPIILELIRGTQPPVPTPA